MFFAWAVYSQSHKASIKNMIKSPQIRNPKCVATKQEDGKIMITIAEPVKAMTVRKSFNDCIYFVKSECRYSWHKILFLGAPAPLVKKNVTLESTYSWYLWIRWLMMNTQVLFLDVKTFRSASRFTITLSFVFSAATRSQKAAVGPSLALQITIGCSQTIGNIGWGLLGPVCRDQKPHANAAWESFWVPSPRNQISIASRNRIAYLDEN